MNPFKFCKAFKIIFIFVIQMPLPLKHIQSYPLLSKLVHRTGIETCGVEDVLQTVPKHSKGGSPNDLHRNADLMNLMTMNVVP